MPVLINRCSFPSASPIIRSLLLSPFKSPKVGVRLSAGIFRVVFKFIVDILSQSLLIRFYSGTESFPVFSKRANDEIGSLLGIK